jgi:hypothetical protein
LIRAGNLPTPEDVDKLGVAIDAFADAPPESLTNDLDGNVGVAFVLAHASMALHRDDLKARALARLA